MEKTLSHKYDLFVIGGGSAGVAHARRAAEYGAKVAVAENGRAGRHLRQCWLCAKER